MDLTEDPRLLDVKDYPKSVINNKGLSGCFTWMIPNLYLGNGCLTKHSFNNSCLEFQVDVKERPRKKNPEG